MGSGGIAVKLFHRREIKLSFEIPSVPLEPRPSGWITGSKFQLMIRSHFDFCQKANYMVIQTEGVVRTLKFRCVQGWYLSQLGML